MTDSSQTVYRAWAFGLLWQSDIALEHFSEADGGARAADVVVRRVSELAERRPIKQINRGTVYEDGFRFGWEGQVTIDVFTGDRVDYLPGPDWRGYLPPSFYSTVTALLLACRGLLPVHACAIVIDGQAVLICGASGAGKSTLAAGLIAEGASLLSDDLSAIFEDRETVAFRVLAGRPEIRLYPEMAQLIARASVAPALDDPRGKVLLRSSTPLPQEWFPLGGLLYLGANSPPESPIARFALLRAQLFRPQWMAALPGAIDRQVQLRRMESGMRFAAMPSIERADDLGLEERARAALTLIRDRLLMQNCT